MKISSDRPDTLHVYFAYGSNMLTKRLEKRVGNVVIVGKGRLEGFALCFNKHAADGTGTANFEPAIGQYVEGVLFGLTSKQLDILDTFEGTPDHYTRKIVEITREATASKISAVAYVAGEKGKGLFSLKPASEYLGFILDGEKEHGLNVDRIKEAAK